MAVGLPGTTQDSVRGCCLGFAAVAIPGHWISCAFQGATLIEPDVPISGIRIYASEGKKHLPSTTATSALG